MNADHLEMLTDLIIMIEGFTGKELTEHQIEMIKDVLFITYHDGDRNGSERMRKIIEDVRK